MEDVGILDSRNLWLLEDHKWVPMRIRWLDDDLELAAERPAGDEKRDAPAQREEKEEENPKEADGKEDGMGWPAAENIGGFMIGCDNCGTRAQSIVARVPCDARTARDGCPRPLAATAHTSRAGADKWYYGWCVDITEHEAKDIKKYICPKCVIESARKRSGKPLSKRMRTQAAKVQG